MTARDPVPTQRETQAETFACLASDFNLSDAVRDLITAEGIQNLEEFRFLFTKEDDVAPFLAKSSDLAERSLQAVRLRRAWHAVRHQATLREADRALVNTADLDDLLDEASLRSVKVSFWARYKDKFPPEVMPADSLVSRCSREMSRRMLMVFPVWSSKNLEHQLSSSQKRRKIADGLYMSEEREPNAGHRDVATYLDKLFTYLLALSIAGIDKAPKAPPSKEEDTIGSDTTRFVQVPLDVCQAYWRRARKTAFIQPNAIRLQWLERMDTTERSAWVSAFRDSDKTLGEVILATMAARDAHWFTAPVLLHGQASGHPNQQKAAAKARPGKFAQRTQAARASKPPWQQGKGAAGANPPTQIPTKMLFGKKSAERLRDGKKLCDSFQRDQCNKNTPGNPCPNGQHRCSHMLKNGRVCGGSHAIKACPHT